MQHLAAVLVQHSEALGSCSHSLLAAAALELHAAASPVLEGCFSQADSNAELTQALLEGLHAALQHAGHVNGVRRGSVALRLAALLEEQQQLGSGLEVVEQVSNAAARHAVALSQPFTSYLSYAHAVQANAG